MEQTVVELIIKDLDNECKARGMFVNWDMYLAMEKEQIIDAFDSGLEYDYDDSETYYNKTYNK
jgi:hypothetical protein